MQAITSNRAEALAALRAKHKAEIEKKMEEFAALENLGEIPGLSPRIVHSCLYSIRHISFNLDDLEKFKQWAKDNAEDIHAIEGKYKILWPEIPQHPTNYTDASVKATGKVRIDASSITHETKASVFYKGYRISFTLPIVTGAMPVPEYCSYSPRYHGKRKIESWRKTGAGVRQYLRVYGDRQSADLETLLTWEQFDQLTTK